jgi:tricorn protease
MKRLLFSLICFLALAISSFADETRLLRQPTISETHIAYTYGSDLWVTNIENQQTVRLTSTGAVESDPLFSRDGLTIAFTSNRSGSNSVYTVPV